MSVGYRAVLWNRQKRLYDLALASGVAIYLIAFAGVSWAFRPGITPETLAIRACGSCAIVLLHLVLSIGPLCRLDDRFLPLLYNRRHLGVTMFLLAFAHGVFGILQFHAGGDLSPLAGLFASSVRFDSLSQFPFQLLGFLALVILFLMAATSHDFWLHNLGARVWKSVHMLVYVAYALLVMHVLLGALEAERSPILSTSLALGMAWLIALHLTAAARESARDRETPRVDEWVDAGPVSEIAEGRARVVLVGGERVAVFRYGGRVSALSNVCKHQNGPLGEGRIVDGCVTCPWHGYQYLPESGSSPPPFHEKVPTYRCRVEQGRVLVDPQALPAGSAVPPARIGDGA